MRVKIVSEETNKFLKEYNGKFYLLNRRNKNYY